MFRKKDKTQNGNGLHPEFIVQIEDVHKSFVMGKEAVPALRGVSLDVKRGEILCLMGPSGSGKTTMLNIIGGLDTPSRGHVSVDGENVVALNEEKLAALRLRKMGFVFQNFNLLSNFTAMENVQVPMVLMGQRDPKRAKELLGLVGLGDRMTHYPSELSGGQQQRVAIARALVHAPPLLVCDEPTSALDSENGLRVMEILRSVARQDNRTVIVVTHDPRIYKFADRMAEMEDGRIHRVLSTPAEIAAAHPAF
jgi:putative ABC transport system ATP-binding protein